MQRKMSEYNRDQWISFHAIDEALRSMPSDHRESLRRRLEPYLAFREEVDRFQEKYFSELCERWCYANRRSACCGFESIFTFFADQVIAWVLAGDAERSRMLRALERPFRKDRCVYLGPKGCLWPLRPISCALFYCPEAKEEVFRQWPEARITWEELRKEEKRFTWPDRPVLFDEIERCFRERGVDSPHMYFHKSPGLLLVKKKAGLISHIRPARP